MLNSSLITAVKGSFRDLKGILKSVEGQFIFHFLTEQKILIAVLTILAKEVLRCQNPLFLTLQGC